MTSPAEGATRRPPLVLASTSTYRAQLLARLGLPFQSVRPAIDEPLHAGEAPAGRARRLAREKAAAVVQQRPGAIVIGSDQVAAIGTVILHKPGDAAGQRAQLQLQCGQQVDFHTGLCVVDALGQRHEHVDHTRCRMRQLTEVEIERYVRAEPAYDCAGGFKVEGLGISLFSTVESVDPTALIGLPLVALCACLRQCGVEVP